MARNVALDAMRKRPTFSLDSDQADGVRASSASVEPSPYTVAARTQDAERLAHSLQTLEPIYREALVLRFQEDLSLQEISEIVGAPVSTVASRIYRGLATLRPHFKGDTAMKLDHHNKFQHMIDESLAGVLSAKKEQSLRVHLSTCSACREYLSTSNRVIAGLSGFSFECNPTLNAKILAVLRLQAEDGRGMHERATGTMRLHNVPFRSWAAFALALLMSLVGSGLMYQMAQRLVSTDSASAHIQAGVLLFWLLPSLCAAFCLLAPPDQNRGIA